jgi:hypothetical protein
MDRISTSVYNSFASGYKSITGPSYLDSAVYHQYGGVPVLAIGLAATIGVVLTYATLADTFSAISESFQESMNSSASYVGNMFSSNPSEPVGSNYLREQSEPGEQYKITGGKAKTKKRTSRKYKRISKKRKNI